MADMPDDQAPAGAYERLGITHGPGPGDILEPGQPRPHDYQRGLLTEGHEAVSPQHEPPARPVPVMPPGSVAAADGPAVRHVDLSGARG